MNVPSDPATSEPAGALFASPYHEVIATEPTCSDAWYAAVNTLRHGCGLPTVGHGLTYDFWAGLEAFKRIGCRNG